MTAIEIKVNVWWLDSAVIADVIEFIEERDGAMDRSDILYMLRKPWKYTAEHKAMLAHGEGLLCSACEAKRGEKRADAKEQVLCAKCFADYQYDTAVDLETRLAMALSEDA